MRRQGPASEMSSGTEKGYQILHSTHLSGLDLRGTLVLLLAALNFLLFFPLFFSTPFLPTKYSLEQGPKTSDSFLGNVLVTKLWGCL